MSMSLSFCTGLCFGQTEIDQLDKHIVTTTSETNMDRETLENLIHAMKKRDDETLCLMKYTRQDDIRSKVSPASVPLGNERCSWYGKELAAQSERYSAKSIELHRAVNDETVEYASLQIELNKIADTFRRSYVQRQQLIERWEAILVQMQRKDHDIDQLAIVRRSSPTDPHSSVCL